MRRSNFDRRRMLALLGRAGGAIATMGTATSASAAGDERSANDRHVEPLSDSADGAALSLNTRLTREYRVRYPFVSAGMGFVSYPPLVTAVSNAGGIGVLGNAVEPPPSTQSLVRMIAEGTTNPFGVDLLHDITAFGPATTDAHIDVCVSERVKLVVFHMNVPPRAWVDRLHAAGCRVWQQAASVEQAVEAAHLDVDAVSRRGGRLAGTTRASSERRRFCGGSFARSSR